MHPNNSPEKLKKLDKDLFAYFFFWTVLGNLFGIGAYLLAENVLHLERMFAVILAGWIGIFCALGTSKLAALASLQPLKAVWQALWHISPNGGAVGAPDITTLTHGRDVADGMVNQIYDLSAGTTTHHTPSPQYAEVASVAVASEVSTPAVQATATPATDLISAMPLPILGLDAQDNIVLCNKAACDYLKCAQEECVGKSVYDVMRLSFREKNTLENWLSESRSNAVTAVSAWDRVKLDLPDDAGIHQFDMIARYSKGASDGIETLLALFDKTDEYAKEDDSTSYVALAVHELRTPLTVLRGYIEVFEDELGEKLSPELRDFMHKMSASAQTLTAFVSNILNVARVDENQLNLSLHEANWNDLLPSICKDLELRARVRGKKLVLDIAPNLPTVAVDKVSIYEVVSNLVDNAIKYSGTSDTITIRARISKEGTVETIVEDKGSGMPESTVKQLFTKFYRSHRSKGAVGGTGLGLYLVKAFVSAHGGQVWVQSHEGEGSQFGFTLVPYANLASELKDTSNGGIERQAHGWIKNHSMYRR